jgi:TPR repeat protein
MPLKSVLGTPDACIEAARSLAQRAESMGDLALAETLLRGLAALDGQSMQAAEDLARVLLARALASSDPAVLRDAQAWADYAVQLGSSHAIELAARCRRLR